MLSFEFVHQRLETIVNDNSINNHPVPPLRYRRGVKGGGGVKPVMRRTSNKIAPIIASTSGTCQLKNVASIADRSNVEAASSGSILAATGLPVCV
jgi:hypothetical protein